MKLFTELGLAEPILRALTTEGYTTPTPIQAQLIPVALQGRDVIGIAQTGTGKTAAFVLPILHRLGHEASPLSSEKFLRTPKTCKVLILAPTRELASQIAQAIRNYGRFSKRTVALVVGGASPLPQIKALAPGVDIVVATPGRLLDHVRAGKIRLDSTSTVVLDEADQMLDLGFMPAIKDIMSRVSRSRQTILLSATMPKPIRELAEKFMSSPQSVSIAPESKTADKIDQEVILIEQSRKSERLISILAGREVDRAIVFTRTKRGADRLERTLRESGLSSVAIHGNKSQGQRNKALSQFKTGDRKILVATDVAARGIDIDNVSHVVNFDLPTVAEAYVHRIGRTGRAGKSGIAISLCDQAERGLLRDIERLICHELQQKALSPEVLAKDIFVLSPLPEGHVPARHAPQGQAKPSARRHAKPRHGQGRAKASPRAPSRAHFG